IPVSPTGGKTDTIAWLDHRATAEAAICTAATASLLGHAGGAISPEMQLPKLMWLRRHLPESWARAAGFYDLADFLTLRATGSPARSLSTLAAKWGFDGRAGGGWPHDLL